MHMKSIHTSATRCSRSMYSLPKTREEKDRANAYVRTQIPPDHALDSTRASQYQSWVLHDPQFPHAPGPGPQVPTPFGRKTMQTQRMLSKCRGRTGQKARVWKRQNDPGKI